MINKIYKPLTISFISLTLIGFPFVSAVAQPQNLQDRIERLERMADNPVLMQQSQRINQQHREIQQLHDRVDRLQNQLRITETHQNNFFRGTDARLNSLEAKLEQNLVVPTIKATKDIPKIAQPLQPTVPKIDASIDKQKLSTVETKTIASSSTIITTTRAANEAEQEQYQAIFSLMKNKQYAEAHQGFLKFQKTFPTINLASNALYWAGEAALVLQKNDLALESFMNVVNIYPNSLKLTDSLLRAGDTLRRMGNIEQAKEKYNILLEKHPRSQAAGKVKQRLEKLGN